MGPTARCSIDSWSATGPTYTLRDPATQSWTKDVARALDRGFNALVGAPALEDFAEPASRSARRPGPRRCEARADWQGRNARSATRPT